MRKGGEGSRFLRDEKGDIFGVYFAGGQCAEHEEGIEDILEMFGVPLGVERDLSKINSDMLGIKGRTVSRFNEELFFFEAGPTHSVLIFEPFWGGVSAGESFEKGHWEIDTLPADISVAWSKRAFGVVADHTFEKNRPHKKFMEALYEAFRKKDVAIWLGGSGNPFAGCGLVVVIASLVPEKIKEKMRRDDASDYRLMKAMAETGIEKILKAAGKRYYVLSPSWKDDKETEIRFLLNPCEQKENNYGWFSLQDLKDWAEGKGPIPIPKEQ